MKIFKQTALVFLFAWAAVLLASCSLLRSATSGSSSSSDDGSRSIQKSASSAEDYDEKALERRMAVFQNAPLVPVENGSQMSFKSADNGVYTTNGAGEPVVDKRSYSLPDNWSFDYTGTKDREQDMTFRVTTDSSQFLVQLYALDAYSKSPLDGGQVMSEADLAKRMKRDGREFKKTSSVEIDGKKWHVGLEVLPENNLSGLVFYRLEDTGNFNDTLLVGSFIFPLESSKDFEQDGLKEVGHLKAILAQLSKDK